MKTMKKSQHAKEATPAKTVLQARVLFRDQDGTIHDVTHSESEFGFGLKSLLWGSAGVEEGFRRITELVQVLALAAEKRSTVDANLVQRILEEISETLDEQGEVVANVRYIRDLLEEAEGLPPIDTTAMQKAFQPRPLLKVAS